MVRQDVAAEFLSSLANSSSAYSREPSIQHQRDKSSDNEDSRIGRERIAIRERERVEALRAQGAKNTGTEEFDNTATLQRFGHLNVEERFHVSRNDEEIRPYRIAPLGDFFRDAIPKDIITRIRGLEIDSRVREYFLHKESLAQQLFSDNVHTGHEPGFDRVS